MPITPGCKTAVRSHGVVGGQGAGWSHGSDKRFVLSDPFSRTRYRPKTSTKVCLISRLRGPFFAEGSLRGSPEAGTRGGGTGQRLEKKRKPSWMLVERWNLGPVGEKRRIKWIKGNAKASRLFAGHFASYPFREP